MALCLFAWISECEWKKKRRATFIIDYSIFLWLIDQSSSLLKEYCGDLVLHLHKVGGKNSSRDIYTISS